MLQGLFVVHWRSLGVVLSVYDEKLFAWMQGNVFL